MRQHGQYSQQQLLEVHEFLTDNDVDYLVDCISKGKIGPCSLYDADISKTAKKRFEAKASFQNPLTILENYNEMLEYLTEKVEKVSNKEFQNLKNEEKEKRNHLRKQLRIAEAKILKLQHQRGKLIGLVEFYSGKPVKSL